MLVVYGCVDFLNKAAEKAPSPTPSLPPKNPIPEPSRTKIALPVATCAALVCPINI